MQVLAYLTFLVVSHFGVMQIFRLTTYHAYFWKALPLLLGYSALVGYLLYLFKLHQFFLWQVVLASLWLFVIARKQSKTVEAMMALAGDDAEAVKLMAVSTASTRSYYTYSSFIYVIVFFAVYIGLYNA